MEFSATIEGNELVSKGLYHLPYEVYSVLLDHYGVVYIPILKILDRPAVADLVKCADEENTWHITEGQGCGEGIVVKRYDFINKYGRPAWAKVLNTAFFQKKNLLMHKNYEDMELEEKIVDKYITQDLVNKEYLKLTVDTDQKVPPAKLLGIMWRTFIDEFIWDILKDCRNPVIDFRKLRKACDLKVKQSKPEMFGGTALPVVEKPKEDPVEKSVPLNEDGTITVEFNEEEMNRIIELSTARNITPEELLNELLSKFAMRSPGSIDQREKRPSSKEYRN